MSILQKFLKSWPPIKRLPASRIRSCKKTKGQFHKALIPKYVLENAKKYGFLNAQFHISRNPKICKIKCQKMMHVFNVKFHKTYFWWFVWMGWVGRPNPENRINKNHRTKYLTLKPIGPNLTKRPNFGFKRVVLLRGGMFCRIQVVCICFFNFDAQLNDVLWHHNAWRPLKAPPANPQT